MGSINIYINDVLKEEMADVEANWSEICREAIKLEIARLSNQNREESPLDFSKNHWVMQSFEEKFNNEQTIIKPYIEHSDPKIRNTVKIASEWLAQMKKDLSLARVDQSFLSEFVNGRRKIEILEPGQNWRSCYLQVNLQFNVVYEDNEAPIDAEIIPDSALLVSSTDNKPKEKSEFIYLDLPDLKTINQENIKALPAEVYRNFKRAWEEFVGDTDDLLSSKKLKQLWSNWYYPNHDFDRLLEQLNEYDWSNMNQVLTEEQRDFLETFERESFSDGFDDIYRAFMIFIAQFIDGGEFMELNQLDPRRLNNIWLDKKDNLPELPGIYFIINERKIYGLGITENLYEHCYHHPLIEQLEDDKNVSIAYITGTSIHYLHQVKSELIERFSPFIQGI